MYNCKISIKKEYLTFAPKILDFDIFGLKIENKIVIFKVSPLKLVWLQNITEKQNWLNLWPKMPYLVIFREEFQKSIVILEISTFNFLKFQKCLKNKKRLNLGPKVVFLTENTQFRYLWDRIVILFLLRTFKFV